MSRIKIWNKVPDNSQLHVQVEGGTGTAQGILTVSDGTTEDWTDGELRVGKLKKLRKPKLYSLSLILRFAAPSTMTVKGHVERPGGNHHGQDYKEPVTGAAGDVKTVAISVITLQN